MSRFRSFFLILTLVAVCLPSASQAGVNINWSNVRLGVDAGWGLGWGGDLDGYAALGSRLSLETTYRVFTESDIGLFYERYKNASSSIDGVDNTQAGLGLVARAGLVNFPVFVDVKLGTAFALGGGYRFPIFYAADLCPHFSYTSVGNARFLSLSALVNIKL